MLGSHASSFENIDSTDGSTTSHSSAKGSKKKANKNKKKANKNNPYATRGLDKYSTVLGELEARRARIIEKAGPRGVSLVKFMYSDSADWIPVVVRRRDEKLTDADADNSTAKQQPEELPPGPPAQLSSEGADVIVAPTAAAVDGASWTKTVAEQKVKEREAWDVEEVKGWLRRNWMGSCDWPLVTTVLLILSCLVMFGRVFAICCLLIWWYLVPMVNGDEGANARSTKKKKNEKHGRRMSNSRLSGSSILVAR